MMVIVTILLFRIYHASAAYVAEVRSICAKHYECSIELQYLMDSIKCLSLMTY
jgi:hypothetical protein